VRLGSARRWPGLAYTYDADGRLTQVDDSALGQGGSVTCTRRVYGFDAESDRTSLASFTADADGACNSDPANETDTGYSYDAADRLLSDSVSNLGGTSAGTAVSGSYGYDQLGRTSTLPAVDAAGIGSHAGLSGDVSIGYYANDYVNSQSQGVGAGADTITFTLDPMQDRVRSQSDSASGVSTIEHYGDDSDSPVWTVSSDGSMTRNLIGPDGSLAGSVDQTGTVTWDVVNPHGDVVGQIANDTTATPAASGFSSSTEYGAPRVAADAYDTYGWVGSHRRSSNDLAGLVLMGVRLYNPTTGRFLSTDPISGGNPNTYTYPTDPINGSDLSGACPWCLVWGLELLAVALVAALTYEAVDHYGGIQLHPTLHLHMPHIFHHGGQNETHPSMKKAKAAAKKEANSGSGGTYRGKGNCDHYHCDYKDAPTSHHRGPHSKPYRPKWGV